MPVGDKQVIKGSPSQLKAKKRQAQDRVLLLLASGVSVTEAMTEVGRRKQTFYNWCKQEQWFETRAHQVRTRTPEENKGFIADRLLYFGNPTPWHQEQIVRAIEEAQDGTVTMILLPPGGGKTTVLEDWFNLVLARNPNYRIAVISETATLGKKILGNVQNRMTDETLCPTYINTFGPFKASDRQQNKPWNATFFTHVQANSGERDYSMEVKGAGSSIYGASFDLILCDDIQSQETLTRTEMLMTYFTNTLYSRIMRANTTGKIVIIGTRQGQGDIYEELLKVPGLVDTLIQIPARDDEGHSYFPRREYDGMELGFSDEMLTKIEAVVGDLAWSRQYMQQPISKHGQTFSDRIIEQCLDEFRGIQLGTDHNVPGMYRVGTIDPALGGHCVFRIGSFDFQDLYLLDGLNYAGYERYDQIWDQMEEFTIKWRPQVWVIETNAIQGGIARSDRVTEMAEKYGFLVLPHQTGKNKQDEQIGVAAMATTFLSKHISIPWGTDEARGSFKPMVEQLKKWRPDIPTKMLVQDEVMALWFMHLFWQKYRAKFAVRVQHNVRRPGLPWKPTGYSPIGAHGHRVSV